MKAEIIYFDTNFFYYINSGRIPKDYLKRFITYTKQQKIKLFYTPITFTEVVSHINREKAQKFKRYQSILCKIKDICDNNILENPGHTMASIFGVSPPERPKGGSPSDLNPVRDLICNAKDYNQLIQGQILYWDGRLSIVKYQEDIVKNFRADYEAEWILDMYRFVVDTINPNYLKQLHKGKTPIVTNKVLRNKIIAFLDTPEFKRTFIDASFCKATNLPKESLIGQLNEKKVDRLLEKLSAYFAAYKTIVRKIVEEGYGVSKNKNDFNDLHYLIYLALGSHIMFVTYDERLKEKIKGSEQESQVTTVENFMKDKV